jgi:hypothetical protein
MEPQQVFNNLFTEESNEPNRMPAKLADFINTLITCAQSNGVNKENILNSLCIRLFGVELAQVNSGFDSKPRYSMSLHNFANPSKFALKDEAFDKISRRLKTTDVLIAMVDFINDPQGDAQFTTIAKQAQMFNLERLDPQDQTRARKIDLMGKHINNSIKFDNTNYFAKTPLEVCETSSLSSFFQNLAKKLVKMDSALIHDLTQVELDVLGNPEDRARGGFIYWLVKVSADAARGYMREAYSVGIKNYDDLLKVINNIHRLSKN